MKRELVNQIRELMERHLDVVDIAARLNIDLDTVRIALDIIKEIIT
jgi:orotate phosphoribosyltransferase-like protein